MYKPQDSYRCKKITVSVYCKLPELSIISINRITCTTSQGILPFGIWHV